MKTSVLFLGLFLGGCMAAAPPPEAKCPPPAAPPVVAAPPPVAPPPVAAAPPVASGQHASTFADAVKDAAIAEPSEVSTDLLPIVESTPGLKWKGETGARRVLVTTWTSWNGYDDKKGKAIPLAREVWVTAAPKVREFCKGMGAAAPARVEKLLGLPANGGKDRWVELWADPADMFRPCPDPEITDRECGVEAVASKAFVTVSPEHLKWFEALKATSYGDKGYPWTRLGYTYDWGNPASEVGMSEFVIRAGATVEVDGVLKNDEYCK